MGITTPIVLVPFWEAGTTCPAPPMGGLIPGIGPGWKIKSNFHLPYLYTNHNIFIT